MAVLLAIKVAATARLLIARRAGIVPRHEPYWWWATKLTVPAAAALLIAIAMRQHHDGDAHVYRLLLGFALAAVAIRILSRRRGRGAQGGAHGPA